MFLLKYCDIHSPTLSGYCSVSRHTIGVKVLSMYSIFLYCLSSRPLLSMKLQHSLLNLFEDKKKLKGGERILVGS